MASPAFGLQCRHGHRRPILHWPSLANCAHTGRASSTATSTSRSRPGTSTAFHASRSSPTTSTHMSPVRWSKVVRCPGGRSSKPPPLGSGTHRPWGSSGALATSSLRVAAARARCAPSVAPSSASSRAPLSPSIAYQLLSATPGSSLLVGALLPIISICERALSDAAPSFRSASRALRKRSPRDSSSTISAPFFMGRSLTRSIASWSCSSRAVGPDIPSALATMRMATSSAARRAERRASAAARSARSASISCCGRSGFRARWGLFHLSLNVGAKRCSGSCLMMAVRRWVPTSTRVTFRQCPWPRKKHVATAKAQPAPPITTRRTMVKAHFSVMLSPAVGAGSTVVVVDGLMATA
mmetsp:Transcript_17935/g.48088  ORF Transcript_17935/g.48088 Transcript_17935/m.48088 type:complete len:355 (+) Transcript_17935:176-1240(+)